jgi:hypothetical protein
LVIPPLVESKRIIITPEKYTIDANKQFSVTVFDETGEPIYGATVGVQNSVEQGAVTTTNADGRAVLMAPNRDTIIIIAQKEGYLDGQETLWVNTYPGFLSSLLDNQYTAILIAVCILVFIVIFVSIRNHKKELTITSPTPNLPLGKLKREKVPRNEKSQDSPRSHVKDSKIEEIRITRENPQKTIISIDRFNQKKASDADHRKKNIHKWFEGNKNIEHTIDSLTRSIEKEKEHRWYEGTEDIRKKIDRALNKNNE